MRNNSTNRKRLQEDFSMSEIDRDVYVKTRDYLKEVHHLKMKLQVALARFTFIQKCIKETLSSKQNIMIDGIEYTPFNQCNQLSLDTLNASDTIDMLSDGLHTSAWDIVSLDRYKVDTSPTGVPMSATRLPNYMKHEHDDI